MQRLYPGMTRSVGTALRCLLAAALLTVLLVADAHAARRGTGLQAPAAVASMSPDAWLQTAEAARTEDERRVAVIGFLTSLPATVPPYNWSKPVDVGPYRVTFAAPRREAALWDPTYFDGYVNPALVATQELRSRIVTAGEGTPLIGVRRWSSERAAVEPLMPPVGYFCPVTAVVEFKAAGARGQRDVVVKMYNPAATDAPLAADYTAPLELLLSSVPSNKEGRQGLKRPSEYIAQSGLILLEPYQQSKIPVVFVHGLDSSPRTWQDAFNELRADAVIRQRYQFWFFRYPTGNPVPLSAALLRGSLQEARATFDPKGKSKTFNQMVVIGHSMGGLLTRLMVTEPGDVFWSNISQIPFEQARMADGDRALLQRILFFNRQPYVKRVVFVATPHRGSMLAESALGKLGRGLIRVPAEAATLPARIVAGNPGLLRQGLDPRNLVFPTGIDNLKPNNQFVRTLQQQPILAPSHTIVGDRGMTVKGEPVSDGVVPYWSSRLDCDESEVAVPSNHSAHHHPAAIRELDRILRLHLSANN